MRKSVEEWKLDLPRWSALSALPPASLSLSPFSPLALFLSPSPLSSSLSLSLTVHIAAVFEEMSAKCSRGFEQTAPVTMSLCCICRWCPLLPSEVCTKSLAVFHRPFLLLPSLSPATLPSLPLSSLLLLSPSPSPSLSPATPPPSPSLSPPSLPLPLSCYSPPPPPPPSLLLLFLPSPSPLSCYSPPPPPPPSLLLPSPSLSPATPSPV